jgi:dethiobiotin synthetase
MHGFLITGSDTGVGKTVFTAALARLWHSEGRSFRVCKLVATGAVWQDGAWRSEDTLLLAEAAGDRDLDAITPWAFPTPAAPPVAARLAGAVLRIDALAEAVRRRAADGSAVLVEGVGGLLCPLTETETVADLAGRLGLPLVVVVRRSLGTLNHTLLTVEAAERRGLPLAGVVVNETTPVEGTADETNVEELRRRLPVPLLAVLPHRRPGTAMSVDPLRAVGWWRLAVAGPGSAETTPVAHSRKSGPSCKP